MSPRLRAIIQACILLGLPVGLVFIFPRANAFAQMAAREPRYFWWLRLLVALAIWFKWGDWSQTQALTPRAHWRVACWNCQTR
jgi:hypothetical protein